MGCAHCAKGVRVGHSASAIRVPLVRVGLRALRHARAAVGPLRKAFAPIAPCEGLAGVLRQVVTSSHRRCADCAMRARHTVCLFNSLSIYLPTSLHTVSLPLSARPWRNARSLKAAQRRNTPATEYSLRWCL